MAEFSSAFDEFTKTFGMHDGEIGEMEVDVVGSGQCLAEQHNGNGHTQLDAIVGGRPSSAKADCLAQPGVLWTEDLSIDSWVSNDMRGSLEALNLNAVPPNSPEPGSIGDSFARAWQERGALDMAAAEDQLVAHVACISLSVAMAKQPASKKIFGTGESTKKLNGMATRRRAVAVAVAVDSADDPLSVQLLESVREKKKMARQRSGCRGEQWQ